MGKKTPLWLSIAQTLRTDIAEGVYGPGDKIPAEVVLSQRFGVNRHTVRRAIAQLTDDGLVYARRGSGVFVAATPTDYPIGRRTRYSQNLRAAGRTPSRRVLLLETRLAGAREREVLGLPRGEHVHIYEGISLAENQPIALFQSAFPAHRFIDLLDHLRENPSVTAALRQYDQADYTRASTRIIAALATPTQAVHLRIAENAPILRTDGVNNDAAGQPIEMGRTWFSGDRVTLTLE